MPITFTFIKGRPPEGGINLMASGGVYTITGSPVGLRKHRRLVAQGGSYALTGQAATLTRSGPMFFVGPSGNNANPGTQAQPWATIQHAADTVTAGGTIILLDGMYTEGQIVFQTHEGTQANPITLKAQNKWQAVINSTSLGNPAISILADYITIENLKFQRDASTPFVPHVYSSANCDIRAWNSTDPEIGVEPSTGYVGAVIRGVWCTEDATPETGRDIAVKSNQDFTVIEDCVLNNEMEIFNGRDCIVRNNVITGSGFWGAHCTIKGGARDNLIYGNEVHITTSGDIESGINVGGSGGGYFDPSTRVDAYNCVAFNNVIINETANTQAALIGFSGAVDCVIFNNVGIGGQLFIREDTGSPDEVPKTTNPTFINNIMYANGQASNLTSGLNGWDDTWDGDLIVDHNNFNGYSGGVPAQTNAVSGNPLFVNPANDWHLQAGSPCIGAGVVVTVPKYYGGFHVIAFDKDGTARVNPWSLGIYE